MQQEESINYYQNLTYTENYKHTAFYMYMLKHFISKWPFYKDNTVYSTWYSSQRKISFI